MRWPSCVNRMNSGSCSDKNARDEMIMAGSVLNPPRAYQTRPTLGGPKTQKTARNRRLVHCERFCSLYFQYKWCPRGDLNPHPLSGTSTSS